MQFANRFKYMVRLPHTASYTEPPFSSKRQWAPAGPPNLEISGDGKKFFGAVPSKPWTKSPPLRLRMATNRPPTENDNDGEIDDDKSS